jgi:EmrB/QacA subfamily drug resistance transporter
VSDEPDPRRWRALAVCLVAGFMTLLDVSIVNVALPSIQDGLEATPTQLQWVVVGYALALGLVLVPAGRLGDARGRRRAFVLAITLFTLGSAACGVAPDAGALVAARVVQGVGGGLLQPQISGLIQQLFRGAERGRAFGLFGGTVGVSTAAGPLIGGLILTGVGGESAWRWVFLVNVPIGLLAVVLGLRLLPADAATRPGRFDPGGTLLLGGALAGILLPLLERGGLPPAVSVASVAAGVALLAAFVVWERRVTAGGGAPVVDLGLLAVPRYRSGLLVGAAYFAGFTSIFFVLTLYLQAGLGYTPLQAGLAQTPFALGGAVSAPLAGRVVTDVGRRVVVAGLAVAATGLVSALLVVAVLPPERGGQTGWWLALPLLLAGAGGGMVISPNVTLTLAEVPVKGAGSGAGVLQTVQRVGSAVGIAAVGAAFFVVLGDDRWRPALLVGLGVSTALVVLALLPAVLDLRRERSGRRVGAG